MNVQIQSTVTSMEERLWGIPVREMKTRPAWCPLWSVFKSNANRNRNHKSPTILRSENKNSVHSGESAVFLMFGVHGVQIF